MMLEELQRRNYSAITTRNYLRVVADFAKFFGKSPDKLGLNELRTYQAGRSPWAARAERSGARTPSQSASSDLACHRGHNPSNVSATLAFWRTAFGPLD